MTKERLASLVVECCQTIGKPAETVWQVVRSLRGVLLPDGIIETPPTAQPASESLADAMAESIAGSRPQATAESYDDGSVSVAASPHDVAMEQRVVEIDDALMTLRVEMTVGHSVCWSSYQSRIRIEPIDPYHARAIITCLATPTAEPAVVEEMLKRLSASSLRSLKRFIDGL